MHRNTRILPKTVDFNGQGPVDFVRFDETRSLRYVKESLRASNMPTIRQLLVAFWAFAKVVRHLDAMDLVFRSIGHIGHTSW